MDHTIIFETEVECPPETEALLDRVISATLEAEGVALPCEISVLLTDDAGIHQINREKNGRFVRFLKVEFDRVMGVRK